MLLNYSKKEKGKKLKCAKQYRECDLNFTPYAATTNLALGDEFKWVIKSIARRLE